MNAQTKIEAPTLAKLREPFPDHQISKLPKETGAQAKQRKADQDAGRWPPKCAICGGFHHPKAVHLDYVGHAALTDRLLDTDPEWTWEPVALGDDGLPRLDRNGGLWIRLTVLGVTRLGYGDAEGKQGGNAIKEAIGDALRNAAMRFGAALDLWHKGDLHAEEETAPGGGSEGDNSEASTGEPHGPADYIPPEPMAGETRSLEYSFPDGPARNITTLKAMARNLWREIEGCGDNDELNCLLDASDTKAICKQLSELENPEHLKIWEGDGGDNPGVAGLITRKQTEFAQRMVDYMRAG